MPVPTDAWVDLSAAASPVFSRDGATLYHLRGVGLPQVWAMDLEAGTPGGSPFMTRRSPSSRARRRMTD